MKFNLYGVWDATGAEAFTIFASKTDGMAVRENMPTLARMRPIKDLTLYKIGEWNNETMEIKPAPKQAVSWDAYKFPETKSEIKTTKEKEEENK